MFWNMVQEKLIKWKKNKDGSCSTGQEGEATWAGTIPIRIFRHQCKFLFTVKTRKQCNFCPLLFFLLITKCSEWLSNLQLRYLKKSPVLEIGQLQPLQITKELILYHRTQRIDLRYFKMWNLKIFWNIWGFHQQVV